MLVWPADSRVLKHTVPSWLYQDLVHHVRLAAHVLSISGTVWPILCAALVTDLGRGL